MFIIFINIIFTIHHLYHLLHHHCYHHHLNHLHHPQSVSLIARVTSVKSSIGIITHHQSSQSVSQWPTSRVSGDVRYSISWVFLALHHKLYLCICTASRQVPPQTSARPYKCQHGYNKWHLSSWYMLACQDLVFIIAKSFHHFLPTKWRDVLLLQLKPLWGEVVPMFVDDVYRNPLTTSLRWVGPPIFGPGVLDLKQRAWFPQGSAYLYIVYVPISA